MQAQAYPDLGYGIWSGPDYFNSVPSRPTESVTAPRQRMLARRFAPHATRR